MTEQELAEIEARAAAATPGPVRALGAGRLGWDLEPDKWPEAGEWYGVRRMFAREADAVFYAAARQDVPRLVAEVRRLQAIIDLTTQALAVSGTRAHAADGCRGE